MDFLVLIGSYFDEAISVLKYQELICAIFI